MDENPNSKCLYRHRTWTVNLDLSHAKKDQTDSAIYMSQRNEVKAVHEDPNFIHTDGSVLDERLPQLQLLKLQRQIYL